MDLNSFITIKIVFYNILIHLKTKSLPTTFYMVDYILSQDGLW